MFLDLPIKIANEQYDQIREASHSSERDGEWRTVKPRMLWGWGGTHVIHRDSSVLVNWKRSDRPSGLICKEDERIVTWEPGSPPQSLACVCV